MKIMHTGRNTFQPRRMIWSLDNAGKLRESTGSRTTGMPPDQEPEDAHRAQQAPALRERREPPPRTSARSAPKSGSCWRIPQRRTPRKSCRIFDMEARHNFRLTSATSNGARLVSATPIMCTPGTTGTAESSSSSAGCRRRYPWPVD